MHTCVAIRGASCTPHSRQLMHTAQKHDTHLINPRGYQVAVQSKLPCGCFWCCLACCSLCTYSSNDCSGLLRSLHGAAALLFADADASAVVLERRDGCLALIEGAAWRGLVQLRGVCCCSLWCCWACICAVCIEFF